MRASPPPGSDLPTVPRTNKPPGVRQLLGVVLDHTYIAGLSTIVPAQLKQVHTMMYGRRVFEREFRDIPIRHNSAHDLGPKLRYVPVCFVNIGGTHVEQRLVGRRKYIVIVKTVIIQRNARTSLPHIQGIWIGLSYRPPLTSKPSRRLCQRMERSRSVTCTIIVSTRFTIGSPNILNLPSMMKALYFRSVGRFLLHRYIAPSFRAAIFSGQGNRISILRLGSPVPFIIDFDIVRSGHLGQEVLIKENSRIPSRKGFLLFGFLPSFHASPLGR